MTQSCSNVVPIILRVRLCPLSHDRSNRDMYPFQCSVIPMGGIFRIHVTKTSAPAYGVLGCAPDNRSSGILDQLHLFSCTKEHHLEQWMSVNSTMPAIRIQPANLNLSLLHETLLQHSQAVVKAAMQHSKACCQGWRNITQYTQKLCCNLFYHSALQHLCLMKA